MLSKFSLLALRDCSRMMEIPLRLFYFKSGVEQDILESTWEASIYYVSSCLVSDINGEGVLKRNLKLCHVIHGTPQQNAKDQSKDIKLKIIIFI